MKSQLPIIKALQNVNKLVNVISGKGYGIKTITLSSISPSYINVSLDLTFFLPEKESQNNDQKQTEHIDQIHHEKVDIVEALSEQGKREYLRTGRINPRAASIIEN
jgi:hypothetical protein